jgi:ATPase subunit of ABC transporter with duplicated ATPase domains
VLSVRDLSVEVGGRLTLTGATFTIAPGDKVGLVGRNGAGKTSLFRVLGGSNPPHTGTVDIRGALGYLAQEPPRMEAGATALSHVLSGRGLDELGERLEKLRAAVDEDPSDRNVARFARAQEAFEAADGYAADAEVRRICAGLGLKGDRVDRQVAVLSGGERRRVELARILFAGSDLLLLDEPTNHLDLDAKAWLLEHMGAYRGALLVISHDLELLDESINRVLHLDEGLMVEYKGTYTEYKEQRAADQERQGKLAHRQAAEIDRLARLADSMRGQTAKRAKMAKSLDKRVDRLESVAVAGPKLERRQRVHLPQPPHCGRTVLEVEDVSKSYGGPFVFEGAGFAVERGERVLIMGLNGAGKTSLLRILAGFTTADSGTYEYGYGVSWGYFAQEHEGIIPGRSVVAHVVEAAPTLTNTEARGLLGMFGLPGEMAFQDAGTLSGGEKTKLALSTLTAGGHNLLLLDEPTNNLDPPSRDAIGAALAGWGGAMVVVSHDPDFVRRLNPSKVLLLPDATLDYWSDDLLDLVALA